MTGHRNFVPTVCAVVFVLWVNGWLWWTLVAAGLAWTAWRGYKRLEEQRAADAVIAARADLQHTQVLAGDERGVYGDGYPTIKEYQRQVG